ncbi:C40 family peptidase [Deinococcus rubellus]|uniref:LysM peptidoglycan-binding domain-containing protein n=1 Tax=Deinococcus rubellus TaxID=1889240 RepID=A0ABY5YF90_9DEIO|nr:LysM peptidoglycan-binding domain-containing protein [Deinococcus rubellus]UWX63724.1 LysM peptidoglycan-binding domain-containing protein [Deinococcus rubellus]
MFRTLLCALLLCPGLALASTTSTAGTPGGGAPGLNAQARSGPSGLSITVQPKDTAYSLARKYNLSVDALLSLNNLSSPDLSAGQVLVVSPPTYSVVKGDTAFSIARRNGLSVDVLLSLNNLTSPNLKLGQVLIVRGNPGTVNASAASVSRTESTVSMSTVSSITVTPALTAPAAPLPSLASTPDVPPSTLIDTALTPPVEATTAASIITTLPADALGSDWLTNARSLLGVPYAYGGKSRSGTDCSGFVLQVFAPLGLSLPRVSADQAQVGVPVERDQLQSGDLVFFDTEGRGKVTHVGIVVEGNTFINANSFAGRVGLDDLGSRYWATRYLGARRVLGVMAASH